MAPNSRLCRAGFYFLHFFKNYCPIHCLICQPNHQHCHNYQHQSDSRLSIPGHLRSPQVSKDHIHGHLWWPQVTYVLIHSHLADSPYLILLNVGKIKHVWYHPWPVGLSHGHPSTNRPSTIKLGSRPWSPKNTSRPLVVFSGNTTSVLVIMWSYYAPYHCSMPPSHCWCIGCCNVLSTFRHHHVYDLSNYLTSYCMNMRTCCHLYQSVMKIALFMLRPPCDHASDLVSLTTSAVAMELRLWQPNHAKVVQLKTILQSVIQLYLSTYYKDLETMPV